LKNERTLPTTLDILEGDPRGPELLDQSLRMLNPSTTWRVTAKQETQLSLTKGLSLRMRLK
jgi:hypothetical protein